MILTPLRNCCKPCKAVEEGIEGKKSGRYEFYQFYDGPMPFDAVQADLKKYMCLYSHFRPHQSLDQLIPTMETD